MKVTEIFLIQIFVTTAYSCTSNSSLYKIIGDAVTLQFQARTAHLLNPATGTVSNLILQPNGDTILTVLYRNGNHVATGKCTGCTFTGNTATGDISIRLDNLQKLAGGIYKHALISGDNVLGCVTVYILGVPSKPAITGDKDPSVGESVTLACSSTSTTTPSNHGLSLIYKWRVDNVDNPSASRYTYSSNKRTLTLSNVVKEDVSKQFTCTTTENVNKGYTSVSSDSFSPNVLYGPENIAFNPTNTAYEKEENSMLNDVTCTAVCDPPCIFTWTKMGQGSVISNTAVLSLGSLASSEAGTYRCTATRSGVSPRIKDLTVNVIYGPRSMSFTPSKTSYREDENVDIPRITCNSECWDCRYSWTGPNSYSSSTSDLDLPGLTKFMAGNYRCTATNIKSQQQTQQSKDLKIEVRYGPESVSLTPATTNYTVDEGTRLDDIKCYADCFPTCTYTWTKEGQPSEVSTTDTLSVGIVQKSYTGKYTCTAINGDKSSKRMEKSVTITVRYGPDSSSTRLSPTTQTYTRNEGTVLPDITCSADCYPDCTYNWTKLRQGSSSLVNNDDTLSLGSLTRDEAASYTCTAKNPGKLNSPTRTVQIEVIVRYGPDPLNCSVQSPFTVTEGEAVQDITCSSDCYPGCSYSWKNDTDNTRSSSGGVLSLRTVNRYMNGSYTLTASNTATQYEQTAEKIITIIVNYAPDVSTRLSSTDITEGRSLTLFCDGLGFPSTNNYVSLTQKWNNVWIPNNNTELPGTEPNSSIHFNQLKLQDTGTYTCTLNNGVKKHQWNIKSVSPKVLTDVLRFTGATHRMAQIRVPVYSFPDLETATVTRYDDKTITTDNKYNITIQPDAVRTMFYGTSVTLTGNIIGLTIRNLEEKDFGNYTLKLTNRLNTTTVKLYLIAADFYIDGYLGQNYVTVNEHDTDVRFRCIVDSTTVSIIKIMFDGDILQQQSNVTSLSFVRNDVACFDAGVYICEGSNSHGVKSSMNVTLFVNCSPRPLRQIQRNITSDLHVRMTLSFTAIAYPEPGPKGFTWHKEVGVGWLQLLSNTDLKISSSGLQSNLTLMNVTKEDFGRYRVTVMNNMGTYEQDLLFSEKGLQSTDTISCRMESENTALIVGVTLGVVCVVEAVYAAYVTIMNRRKTLKKDTSSADNSSKPSTYINLAFTTDATESQEYEGVKTGAEGTSDQQYTDLSRYANTDKDTYDVIKKI